MLSRSESTDGEKVPVSVNSERTSQKQKDGQAPSLGALVGTMGDSESRQLIQRAVRGLPVPRVPVGPLAVHFCARQARVSLRQYTLDSRVLADCVVRYHEEFQPDAVWLSADTWVNAEAMGAAVAFPAGDQPLGGTGQPLVCSAADIDRIPPPDPGSQGRWPLMLDALQRIRQGVGAEVCLVACFDQYPFSLACALLGIRQAMLLLLEDRPLVTALMERCLEYTVAYATALSQAGADLLSGGDSPSVLIHPELYRDVALRFETRVIEQLHEQTTLPVSLHICGDTRHLLSDMISSGADVLELDHQVDCETASELQRTESNRNSEKRVTAGRQGPPDAILPATRPCIWGNINTQLLAEGTPAQVQSVTRQLLRFLKRRGLSGWVLSSGCTLAPDTPVENLRSMIQTVRAEGTMGEDLWEDDGCEAGDLAF